MALELNLFQARFQNPPWTRSSSYEYSTQAGGKQDAAHPLHYYSINIQGLNSENSYQYMDLLQAYKKYEHSQAAEVSLGRREHRQPPIYRIPIALSHK